MKKPSYVSEKEEKITMKKNMNCAIRECEEETNFNPV